MSQANPLIGPNKSGLTYRQEDNDGKQALLTHHKGALPPAYAEAGTLWLDDAATPWCLRIYDGVDWICLSEINAGTNTVLPYSGTSQGRALQLVTGGGAADAYEVTLVPAVAAYAAGLTVLMKCPAHNTGAATLAVDGLTAQGIVMPDGGILPSGAMKAGAIYMLCHDGGVFRLLNPSLSQAGGILQTVSGTYSGLTALGSQTVLNNALPVATNGLEMMSVSLTPKSINSRMFIRLSGVVSVSHSVNLLSALYYNDTLQSIGGSLMAGGTATSPFPIDFLVEHKPATLSPVVYKLRCNTDVGSSAFRPNSLYSTNVLGGMLKWYMVVEEHA